MPFQNLYRNHAVGTKILNMGKTLFDKIWEAHIVQELENGPTQLYIDRHFIHEVTSPQAFEGLQKTVKSTA